ncbi:transcriptional regulator [Methanobrevibacter sp. 87.7]|uniref:helix-turn-helix transcriptional regulator n=1 Tax=Methanobrevibacter sp. 87.7 TaxID=387957 RepID=UPI000B511820|nr:helix-turn-helix transcriptional regulator [Methanobrevibacter sp. 87.7]OWT33462.1 transcriptional regulator [Methanobrevibacter sp. 87.7]
MKTRIGFYRKELGLSQQELADKVGVTRQTINALENGRYNPSLLVAYNITKILKCEHIEDVFILNENEE